MGRELKRKQAKRDGKNVREVQKINKDKPLSPKTFITIMIVLIIFFVMLYILTGIFVTKEIKWFDKKETEEQVTTIKNKILAAETLKQTEETYYVYYYDTTDEDSEVSSVINTLTDKVYRVDLNDGFNSNFIGEPSGVTSDISNLKVSNPTVVKVVAEQITEFHSGKDEIKIALK